MVQSIRFMWAFTCEEQIGSSGRQPSAQVGMDRDNEMSTRTLAALGLAAALLLSTARAEQAALPLALTPGPVASEDGYLSEGEYQDDTLHVRVEQYMHGSSLYTVAHVDIAHPSQLRTALAGAPGSGLHATVLKMAQKNNAVIAINGDYYTSRKTGYVMRQGVLLLERHQPVRDELMIDSEGDFHILPSPSDETAAPILEKYTITQSFSFGPGLVIDGEQQTIPTDYNFCPYDREPRAAIGQTGPLSYVLVICDGRQSGSLGVTMQELAEFMLDLGCRQAYNLDGGSSASMVFHGKLASHPRGMEIYQVSDIIYFATAVSAATTEP